MRGFHDERRSAMQCALLATILIAFLFTACAPYQARRHPIDYRATGEASWYGPGFSGKKTASGERYNQKALTAAHPTLPLGTSVKVTNLKNDRSVIVRINDRGPFARGRIIDLSKGAAEKLGMLGPGTSEVELSAISTPIENDMPAKEMLAFKSKETSDKRSKLSPSSAGVSDDGEMGESDEDNRNGVAALIAKEGADSEDREAEIPVLSSKKTKTDDKSKTTQKPEEF